MRLSVVIPAHNEKPLMFAMALHLREIRAAHRGEDTSWVDKYFFDFNG